MNKVNHPFWVIVQQGNIRSCQKAGVLDYTNRYYSTYLYGIAIYSTHKYRKKWLSNRMIRTVRSFS